MLFRSFRNASQSSGSSCLNAVIGTRFKLIGPYPGSVDGLLDAMARDKKSHHDFTFVLDGVNGPEVVSGVPREVIYEQLLAAGGVK